MASWRGGLAHYLKDSVQAPPPVGEQSCWLLPYWSHSWPHRAALSLLRGVPSQAQRAGSWSKEKTFELSPTKMPRGRTDNPVVGAPSSDVRSSTFRHCSTHGVTLNAPPGLRTGAWESPKLRREKSLSVKLYLYAYILYTI